MTLDVLHYVLFSSAAFCISISTVYNIATNFISLHCVIACFSIYVPTQRVQFWEGVLLHAEDGAGSAGFGVRQKNDSIRVALDRYHLRGKAVEMGELSHRHACSYI